MSQRPDSPTRPDVFRGMAAIKEMLDLIGEGSDKEVSRILVENEGPIREVLGVVVRAAAEEI